MHCVHGHCFRTLLNVTSYVIFLQNQLKSPCAAVFCLPHHWFVLMLDLWSCMLFYKVMLLVMQRRQCVCCFSLKMDRTASPSMYCMQREINPDACNSFLVNLVDQQSCMASPKAKTLKKTLWFRLFLLTVRVCFRCLICIFIYQLMRFGLYCLLLSFWWFTNVNVW